MMFCTKCGHKNVAEARFCEECGNPIVAKSAPPGSPSPTTPVAISVAEAGQKVVSGKVVKWAAIGAIALLVLGSVVAFVLAPESPSNERFAAAIERSLTDNSQKYKSRYCLTNFAYNLDPVRVNEQDEGTRRWMAVLTKAGLYSEPEVLMNSSGFFIVRQLQYTKTEAGKKAIQGRQLCIADGVTVAKVESFTPPEKLGGSELSRATVTLKLRNPMPWITDEEAKTVGPDIKSEFSENVVLSLKEGKWSVASEREVQVAAAEQRKLDSGKKPKEMSSSSGSGFFSSIMKTFSFSSNPLIGRWRSSVMGITTEFEFDNDSMISDGKKIKVRYEVEEKRVTVYPEGESAGQIFKVIDSNTMSIDAGLLELKLTRVN